MNLIELYTRKGLKGGKPYTFIPSTQQASFIHWVVTGKGSCVLIAVAGAGKSTTLVEAALKMSGYVFLGVYNKAAQLDLDHKLTEMGAKQVNPKIRAGTMHSAGFSAWRYVAKEVQIDENKVKNLIQAEIDRATAGGRDGEAETWYVLRPFVLKAVSLAKQNVFGVASQIGDDHAWYEMCEHHSMDEELAEGGPGMEEAVKRCQYILRKSIELDYEVIDFDDMIFCPLYHNVRMFQQDWVLIDEAQDTNLARRMLAKKMLRPGGRLVAVGDPRQAIYGFTGADARSMELIKQEHGAIEMPLTVTYRCPKSVVAFAQQWVSHIEAHESAPEGEVLSLSEAAFTNKEGPLGNQLHVTQLTADDAILCRNNKPLVSMAYSLIRRGIACQVEGREIGSGLIKLATKWKIKTLAQLRSNVKTWKEKEMQKWLAKGKEANAAAVEDKAETIFIMIENLQAEGKQNITDLVDSIKRLFGDTQPGERPRVLTLASGHKSKGREWDRVIWLGRSKYQPSPYARQDWQKVQEENLMYVMATRAKQTLVEVHV